MQWKKQTLRIALISFSMITCCMVSSPGIAHAVEPLDGKNLVAIESIVPTGNDSATELTIKLSSPATYSSYKVTSPLRLVLDFSLVTPGAVSEPIVVNKGNFRKVSVRRFDSSAGVLTRVEIDLVTDREALITETPGNPRELRISFVQSPEDAVSAVSAVTNGTSDTQTPAVPDPAAAPAQNASFRNLTAITAGNNTITLSLDGMVSDFKTFRLNKPERYVIDLMNVRSVLPTRLLPLHTSGVASARIGLYPDKVRIALDAVNGTFPEATAVKTDAGVIITLDPKSGAENANAGLTPASAEKTAEEKTVPSATAGEPAVKPPALPEVKAEVVKPLPQKTTAQAGKPVLSGTVAAIEMIDFQVVDGISRVSVKVAGTISVTPPVKTPGYVTLTVKNSTLPKNLQRSLETRSFVSPVLRITPLMVKNKKSTDTKIRIATRVAASFEYRQEGDMIYIDFKHPAGLAGDTLVIEAAEPKGKAAQPKTEMNRTDDITPDLELSSPPATVSRGYKGRKVTLEFADADVRKIFQLLAEVSNKNFVLSDEVTGAISLKLVNVPWDQALDIILDTKGLDKREDGNIILIKGKGKFKSQADEELEIKKTLAKGIELKTAMFSVNYSDVGAISTQFNSLKSDRGAISTDPRTGTVIVKDIPTAIEDMRKLLKQLDVPERQVMIEARIIEATSTFTRSLGVNWGMHYRDGSSSFAGINQLDTSFGGVASAAPTSGASGAAGAAMGISFGKLLSNVSLDMRLNAAASAGLIKIISSPKVATLNHKPAKISQGQQIPYTSTTSDKIETKFIAATLSLDVTPHINANGTIVMKIDAKNDAPGAGNPPPINTKQATTELLLKDGETTVIGGIFVDSETEGDEGVPYLMDIPLLGNLFKSNTKSKVKSELLIFVTPRILGAI